MIEMTKTKARLLNSEYDRKQQERVRPKEEEWAYKELEQVLAGWARRTVAEKQQKNS